MFDYALFALLFAIATTLAPPDRQEITLVNARHREQQIKWTRGDDDRWAMSINGRDMGHFERTADAIFHHTGQRSPERFRIDELVDLRSRSASRLSLRGAFAPVILHIVRNDGAVILRDPSGEVLRSDLRMTSR